VSTTAPASTAPANTAPSKALVATTAAVTTAAPAPLDHLATAASLGIVPEASCDWPETWPRAGETTAVTCSVVNANRSEGYVTVTLHDDGTAAKSDYVETVPAPTTAPPTVPPTTPKPKPTAPPTSVRPLVSTTDPRFGTCKEAKAQGYGPYVKNRDPEYSWYRDADHDGIVCE
jgi:hypothetical protein